MVIKNKYIFYYTGLLLNSVLINPTLLQASDFKISDSHEYVQQPASSVTISAKNQLQLNIETMLQSIPNHSFKYYKNDRLIKDLSCYIAKKIINTNDHSTSLKTIRSILEKNDFRLISDFLHALILHNEFDHFSNAQHSMREISRKRFENNYKDKFSKKNVLFVYDLDSVFSNIDSNNVTVFIKDQTLQKDFLKVLEESQNNIGRYIDSHYDLPGIDSLVRKGLVKSILLPNGRELVTKKNNPQKKGRFLIEQRNVDQLWSILYSSGDRSIELSQNSPKKAYLKLVPPSIILTDGNQGNLYSLTDFQKGKTLEEVLLTKLETSTRLYHLNNIRSILDTLYDHGIIWGDMAPRNIIVDESDDRTNYHILDFEKTIIFNDPVSLTKRIEHCWGPMCIDEFGAVLSPEEIEHTFRDYLDLSSWKLEVLEEIPQTIPTSLEDFNKLKKEVIPKRFPFFKGYTKNIIKICFKIEHYFGSKYDTKAIEMFQITRNKDYFVELMTLLENSLENIDNKLIILDFKKHARGLPPSNITEDMHEVKLIKEVIDNFYNTNQSSEYYKQLLIKYKSKLQL